MGSRHRPSAATHPPALAVLYPYCSWTAGAECGRGGGRQGKSGLLGPCNPHAHPEIQPRALDPRSWIPWPHSWPQALTVAMGSKGQGGPQLLGRWERRKMHGGVSFQGT